MRVAKTVVGICEQCGNEYPKARTTSRFCGDRCRVRHHRWKDTSVQTPFNQAFDSIRNIGKQTEGELSFQAAIALRAIQKFAANQDISRKDSWWRCQKCWKAVQKDLPQNGDCSCGKTEDARWQLQKRLI